MAAAGAAAISVGMTTVGVALGVGGVVATLVGQPMLSGTDDS